MLNYARVFLCIWRKITTQKGDVEDAVFMLQEPVSFMVYK